MADDNAEWAALGLREKRRRKFRRTCAALLAAKARCDRYAAAECYLELTAFEVHGETALMRRKARQLINRAEIEWYVAEEESAQPWAQWLHSRVRSYAKADPGSERRAKIWAKVREFAEHSITPEIARREAALFLAAPDDWAATWKKTRRRQRG